MTWRLGAAAPVTVSARRRSSPAGSLSAHEHIHSEGRHIPLRVKELRSSRPSDSERPQKEQPGW